MYLPTVSMSEWCCSAQFALCAVSSVRCLSSFLYRDVSERCWRPSSIYLLVSMMMMHDPLSACLMIRELSFLSWSIADRKSLPTLEEKDQGWGCDSFECIWSILSLTTVGSWLVVLLVDTLEYSFLQRSSKASNNSVWSETSLGVGANLSPRRGPDSWTLVRVLDDKFRTVGYRLVASEVGTRVVWRMMVFSRSGWKSWSSSGVVAAAAPLCEFTEVVGVAVVAALAGAVGGAGEVEGGSI